MEYELLIIGKVTIDDIRIHSDLNLYFNTEYVIVEDKFGNICEAFVNKNDCITQLFSYGYYPLYILYRLVTLFKIKVAFIYKDDYYLPDNDWESRSKEDTNSLLTNYKNYNWENYYKENGLDTLCSAPILKNHEPTDRRIFLDDLGDDYYIDTNNNKLKINKS